MSVPVKPFENQNPQTIEISFKLSKKMRPIKQREVGQWIEVEFELPREKARKAAQEYYARYPREGYDTHLPKWYVTKQNLIHFTIRRLKNCD